MSETETQDAAPEGEDLASEWAGWSVVEESADNLTIKHSGGRSLKVRVMDMGDTMDLIEATAGVPTGALDRWMQLAIPVVSVIEIDGVPVPKPTTKERIRARAKELGNERFAAVQWALFMRKPSKSSVDVAKNS